ncbi:hypothetical protein HS088_TW17G00215 [Tripterygium wilfordii]|uniref:Mitochondrial transcription termination factor family protein n=1 Tax=Tripterygium wilfordii TaxID=458696 RepID=A0A7J7CFH2_TRIWF|nr:uncharacterized protein LOC119982339 [Tripterygium wilfordii]XP_038681590.1 uncharacterized protein LOC119982339 [Tripterygium wilfordii]KAF5732685.1 hypothetical protein HS088_TW17G00215 [Tripterygium wilfordii]
MFGYNWTKRLQLVLFPLGRLNCHLRLLEKHESFVIPKSFSSSNKKASIAAPEGNPLPFTVSYLVNSCGFSLDTAKSLSKKVCFENPKRPDSVLDFLRNNGFTNTQISKLIRSIPSVLLTDTEKKLLPKLEFFRSVGISGSDLADVFSAGGNFLACSLKNHIIPTYNFLKKLLKDDDKVVGALKRAGYIRHSANLIAPNILLLQQLGVAQSSIAMLLNFHSCVLCIRTDKFDRSVKKVVEMGFDPLDIRFATALAAILGMTSESWEHKLNVYKRWGWTEDEFHAAFRHNPSIMNLSQENITRKMDLFVNKLGLGPATVAKGSLALCFSMEKRIIPRFSVIKTLLIEGLIKKKPALTSILAITDKCFMDRFVIAYQEQVPQLLDIFQGKVKLLELDFKAEGISEVKLLSNEECQVSYQ